MMDTKRSGTSLIVEDEQPLADLYAQFLEQEHSTYTAYSGSEALEILTEEVDVVFLDRRMPGLSGEEVLTKIRDGGYSCRVAMVTAVTPDVDIIEMGFDEYLTKPVSREALLDAMERLLELGTYDELLEQYYQMASKKAALEAEKPDSALSGHSEYERLTTEFDELERELRERQGDEFEPDFARLLNRPEPHGYDD